MQTGLPALAVLGGVAAIAACGLSLLLLGLGLPYAIAAGLAGLCAGGLIYALGRWAADSASIPQADSQAALRLSELEQEMSALGHELRGALSPALMVSDRLLKSDDPLIRRAGDAVVRSVERATLLLGQDTPVRRPNDAPGASGEITPPAA